MSVNEAIAAKYDLMGVEGKWLKFIAKLAGEMKIFSPDVPLKNTVPAMNR